MAEFALYISKREEEEKRGGKRREGRKRRRNNKHKKWFGSINHVNIPRIIPSLSN